MVSFSRMLKKHLDEQVREPVHEELDAGVVVHPAALDEAAAEDGLVAGVECPPVADGVHRGIRGVGHHDHDGVAPHRVEPAHDRAAEAVRTRAAHRGERRDFPLEGLQHGPGAVAAAVVDHDDFVRDLRPDEFGIEGPQGGRQGGLLVAGRDDDGEEG